MRIAFTHETKPMMKNNSPIMKIDITVSLFVKAVTSIAVVVDLFMYKSAL